MSKDYSHSSTSKCSAKSVCLVNTDLLSLESRRIKTAIDVLPHVTCLCRSFLLYVAAGLHAIRNNSNEFGHTGQCWKYNRRKAKPSYQPILNKIPQKIHLCRCERLGCQSVAQNANIFKSNQISSGPINQQYVHRIPLECMPLTRPYTQHTDMRV